MMVKDKITFSEEEKSLTLEETKKLNIRMNRSLVFGMELETQNERDYNDALIKLFKPTKSYWGVNDNRVVEITNDGSLYSNGNIEIVTIGDNGSFEEQRDKIWVIEEELLKRGYFTDQQTGQHISLLLQKNFRVPSIVMRNIYQLTKYFIAEITYLVATGVNTNYNDGVIRKSAREFAKWGLGNISAKEKTFRELKRIVKETQSAEGKYGFFNIYKNKMMPQSDDVGVFFLEYRIPDRSMSASISVAWGYMLKALIMKAVTISKFGLMGFTDVLWSKKKKLYDLVMNGERTETLNNKELKQNLKEFLSFLAPEFLRMREKKPLKILNYLIDNPLFSDKYYLEKDVKKIGEKKQGWYEVEAEMRLLTDGTKKRNVISEKNIIKTLEIEPFCGTEKEIIKKLSDKTTMNELRVEKTLQKHNYKYEKDIKTFIEV